MRRKLEREVENISSGSVGMSGQNASDRLKSIQVEFQKLDIDEEEAI